MTNAKTTKRALVTSVLALFLCFAMLLGTTYAWFTDSVASSNNIIKTGNLDIVLEYLDGDTWETVEDASNILSGDLWEPGYVDVAYLRVKNAGSLALKYMLGINIVSETAGVNVDGESFKLSDYIYFDVIETAEAVSYETRDAAMAAVVAPQNISVGYTKSETLVAGSDYLYLTMIVYMPTTVGNVANHDGTSIPEIDLGINVIANQATVETDGFDDQYDLYAGKIVVTPTTVQEAIWAAEEGDVIYLTSGEYDTLVLENADGSPKKGITIEHDAPGYNAYENPFSVGHINLNSSEDITIKGIWFDIAKAETVYKYDGTATDFYASISGAKPKTAAGTVAGYGAKNIVIENCKFNTQSSYWEQSTVNPGNYVPICFEEQGRPGVRATNITVKNCYLEKDAFNFIRANYLSAGALVVEGNNTIRLNKLSHAVIVCSGNAADLIIRNNTFWNWNWNEGKAMLSTSYQSGTPTIEVTGNILAQQYSLTGESAVIDMKSSYTTSNCEVIFEGNTFQSRLSGYTEATVPVNLPQ